MPIVQVPVSKFDEPEPGSVSGAVVEPQQKSEGWNSVKQLAATWGLYAATFVLDATASPACLFAATALLVALVALPFLGLAPWVPRGSCFQYVPMGAAMLTAEMLAAFVFLYTGFRSMTTGLEKDLEGLGSAAFDAIASLAATLACCLGTLGFCNCLRCAFSYLCFSKANQPFRKDTSCPPGGWMTRLWMTWRQDHMCVE